MIFVISLVLNDTIILYIRHTEINSSTNESRKSLSCGYSRTVVMA